MTIRFAYFLFMLKGGEGGCNNRKRDYVIYGWPLACVDTINRCLAGFFTLIAMIWKDVRKPQVQTQETANRLTFDRNEARKNFLEGPGGPGGSYPYRRENQNRPYL